jgi:single-strand DNA-binding protein
MAFEVIGKIVKIFDTENKTASFQAREFVIEVPDGNYPQMVKFQLTQDKCGLMDAYKEGEQLKVFFNLRGREWQGKYFTNLDAWRVERVAGGENGASQSSADSGQDPFGDVVFPEADSSPQSDGGSFDDDLPF